MKLCDSELRAQPYLGLIILGPPGAGKGTQSKRLAAMLKIPHISTGDILRQTARQQTSLGMRINEIIGTGALVPDSLVLNLLSRRIRYDDCANGFILDGFPRTSVQAESFDTLSSRLEVRALPVVVVLAVPQEIVLRRLGKRNVCSTCGATYNNGSQIPTNPGKCDRDGSQLVVREDDSEATIRERFRIYEQECTAISKHYSRTATVIQIDANRRVEEVTTEILRVIMERLGK